MQSAAYLQYRGLVAKFRADKSSKESKNSGAELYCPEEALSDNDDIDQGPISNKHISSQKKSEKEKMKIILQKRIIRKNVNEKDVADGVIQIIKCPYQK